MITGKEPINPICEQVAIYRQPDGTCRVDSGLTIRQHFAAMAMQGMLSNPESNRPGVSKLPLAQALAMASVTVADALINELNKEK